MNENEFLHRLLHGTPAPKVDVNEQVVKHLKKARRKLAEREVLEYLTSDVPLPPLTRPEPKRPARKVRTRIVGKLLRMTIKESCDCDNATLDVSKSTLKNVFLLASNSKNGRRYTEVDLKGCVFRKADKTVEVGSTDVVLELRFNTDGEAVQQILSTATEAAKSPFREGADEWLNSQSRATALQRRFDLRAALAEQERLSKERERLQNEVDAALTDGTDPTRAETQLAEVTARLAVVSRRVESLTRIASTAREDSLKDLRARLAVVVASERQQAIETRTAEFAVVNEVVNEIAPQLLAAQRIANLLTDTNAVERIIESVVAEAEGDLPPVEVKPVAEAP